MNSTFKTFVLFLIVANIALLSSCEKDDDYVTPKPTVSGLELGIGDSHVAYIGADLHIEADIVAEGKIGLITVEIHQEEGSNEEIEAEFNEFAGLKNTTFHKHVGIPATTAAGTYHFHMTVTDLEGNSTTVEEEITIEELADEEAPEITISSAPTSAQSFSSGETISISGTITDNTALQGMLVALVYESDNIADADVSGGNSKVIVMMHTHDFDDPDETNFTAYIEVGAVNDNNMTPAPIKDDNAWKSGNYYIIVKSSDAKLNGAASDHYPIKITL